MKTVFVLQDVETKEYYWEWHAKEGFIKDINEAYLFSSKKEAITELKELLETNKLLSNSFIEIKKYFYFPQNINF